MSLISTFSASLDYHRAGVLLAKKLLPMNLERPVVVGMLPRGAWLAAAVAESMRAPLEVLPTRLLKDPASGARTIGTVTEHEALLHECPFDLPQDYIYHEILRLRGEITEEKKSFYGKLTPNTFRNRNVILVDDSICTGDTIQAGIKEVNREHPFQIVVATAYTERDGSSHIGQLCDRFVALEEKPRIRQEKIFANEQRSEGELADSLIRARVWSTL